jgi:hypothetical protein
MFDRAYAQRVLQLTVLWAAPFIREQPKRRGH